MPLTGFLPEHLFWVWVLLPEKKRNDVSLDRFSVFQPSMVLVSGKKFHTSLNMQFMHIVVHKKNKTAVSTVVSAVMVMLSRQVWLLRL